jgi:hypothetical protein
MHPLIAKEHRRLALYKEIRNYFISTKGLNGFEWSLQSINQQGKNPARA